MLGKSQSYFCTPAIAHAAITLIRPDSERSTLTFCAGQRKPCEKWDTRTEMQEEDVCTANARAGHASRRRSGARIEENLVPEIESDGKGVSRLVSQGPVPMSIDITEY